MADPVQMPLDLGRPPAFDAGDFLVADSNREAFGWIERWPSWPGFGLALWGPTGSGKSHLAQILTERAGGRRLAAESLRAPDVDRLADAFCLCLEDADRGVEEAALFHLHNLLRERGHWLLITGRTTPARWGVALPDLRSRLAALPAVALAAPGEDLLGALLLKLFADRQLRVGADLPAYALARVERSFAAVHALVEELDRAALAERRPISAALVRAVLARMGGVGPTLPDPPAG